MGLLLDIKLRPPHLREGHVTRPRLLAQLDRGLAQGLILISAPAGYGKTSLAVEWLGQRPFLTTAWLSLDETDNDLDVFLRYLTTAVHNAFPQERPCATTQTLLNATQPPPLETVANALINDLSQLPHSLLLALDDYHLITLPAIQQVMATLIRHQPDGLQLLLITRADPALPLLARRRAQQRLQEVRAADLRFARAEARAILDQTIGAEVDEATAVLLEEQTEGWIIGLQMAGLSLRDQPDPAAFARAFQERHRRLIMDFLFDEVLAHQPRAVLEFQIWALRALLAQAQGQTEDALSAAEQAVRLTEPGGYLRLFVELGSEMAALLAQVAKRGVAPAYIGRILAVFPTAPSADPDLTRREVEILTLLQQGLSNKEIAGRLFLSVLTVKRHNRNIYQKLGVKSRRAAIAKAKTLNLLP